MPTPFGIDPLDAALTDESQGFGLGPGVVNPTAPVAAPAAPAAPSLDQQIQTLNAKEPGRFKAMSPDEFKSFQQTRAADSHHEITKGLVGGLVSNATMGGNFVQAIGVLKEDRTLWDKGRDMQAWGAEHSKGYEPRVPDWASIRTDSIGNAISDALDWAGYQTGSMVGTTAPSIVAGIAATFVTANPVLGVAAGAALPSFIQNSGDLYGMLRDSPGVAEQVKGGKLTPKDVAQWSLIGGVPMAALDVAGIESIVGAVGMRKMRKTLARRIVNGIATGSLIEGTTEGLQQVIQESVAEALGDEAPVSKRVVSVLESAVAGALGGGVLGGPGHAISGVQTARSPAVKLHKAATAAIEQGEEPTPPKPKLLEPPVMAMPPYDPETGYAPNPKRAEVPMPGAAEPTEKPSTGPIDRALQAGQAHQTAEGAARMLPPGSRVEVSLPGVPPMAVTVHGFHQDGMDVLDENGELHTLPMDDPDLRVTLLQAPVGVPEGAPVGEGAAPSQPVAPPAPPPGEAIQSAVPSKPKPKRAKKSATIEAAPLNTDVAGTNVTFPDETHAGLYKLGRQRQQFREGGRNTAEADKLLQGERERLASEFKIPTEQINQAADDYRHMVQAAVKNAAGKELAAPSIKQDQTAAKWDGLPLDERKQIFKDAKVAWSPKLSWRALSPAIQSRVRGALSQTVDEGAHEAATSPKNEKPEPTKAQIEGDNAELGYSRINGLEYSFENPAGSVRKDLKNTPPKWQTKMQWHYGRIKGTVGFDKDHLDAFVKPGTPTDLPDTAPVFIVDQNKGNGQFDEHKAMIGAESADEAEEAYLAHYSKGWEKNVRGITEMPYGEFKTWAKSEGPKQGPLVDKTDIADLEAKGTVHEGDTRLTSNERAALEHALSNKSGIDKKGDGAAQMRMMLERGRTELPSDERLLEVALRSHELYQQTEAQKAKPKKLTPFPTSDEGAGEEIQPARKSTVPTDDEIRAGAIEAAKDNKWAKEALDAADEIEALDVGGHGFAMGTRMAIRNGQFKTEDDLRNLRQRLTEYKAQAEGRTKGFSEDYTLGNMLGVPNVNRMEKLLGELRTKYPDAADAVRRAQAAFAERVRRINDAGFRVKDVNAATAKDRPAVQEARTELSQIGGAVSRLLNGMWGKTKDRTPERRAADIRGIEDALGEQGAKPTEHPGLIIHSLETGKRTTIQPPGTVAPGEGVAKPAISIDGAVFEGLDHSDAIDQAVKKLKVGYNTIADRIGDTHDKAAESGFTTTRGRFVAREQASKLLGKTGNLSTEDLPLPPLPEGVPAGYEVHSVQRMPAPVARSHNRPPNSFTAIAVRKSPHSTERGFGATAEEAKQDALRRVGAFEKPASAPPQSGRRSFSLSKITDSTAPAMVPVLEKRNQLRERVNNLSTGDYEKLPEGSVLALQDANTLRTLDQIEKDINDALQPPAPKPESSNRVTVNGDEYRLRLDAEGNPSELKQLKRNADGFGNRQYWGTVWAKHHKGLPTGPRAEAIRQLGFVWNRQGPGEPHWEKVEPEARAPEQPKKTQKSGKRLFTSYTTQELKDTLATRRRQLSKKQIAAMEAEIAAREAGESKPKVTPQITPKKAGATTEKWKLIGVNSKGVQLYEDENGVRSYVERGIRITEPVAVVPTRAGVKTEAPEHKGEYLTADEAATEADLAHYNETVKKVRDQQFGEGDKGRKATPEELKAAAYAMDPKGGDINPESNVGISLQNVIDTKTVADADEEHALELAKLAHEKGITNPVPRTGGGANVSVSVTSPEPNRPTYGASNKVFTADAAEKARQLLRNKLKNQLNAGFDPEILAAGIQLTGFHIEAGARKFADVIRAVARDLGVSVADIRMYAQGWYDGARGVLEGTGQDVSDMDTQETVRAQASTLTDQEAENEHPGTQEPSEAPLDQVAAGEGEGAESGGRAGRGPDRSGATGAEGNRAPDEQAALSGARSPRGGAGASHPSASRGRRSAGLGAKGTRRARKGLPEERNAVSDVAPEDAPSVPAVNFRITDEVNLGQGSEAVKFRDNIAAIEVLKRIEHDGRRAEPDEQRALARYVGWGGLANAFRNVATKEVKPDWKDRVEQVEDLLTDSELRQARASTRDAHYTSKAVVDAAWRAATRLGFTGGLTLESSMGTGNFLGLVPDGIAGRTRFIGVEQDSVTARIAKALYPQETVLHSGLEAVPLSDGEFILSIGNPPFGSQSLRFQAKPELHGLSIHNQFFLASLDALRPGGLHIAVVSHYLMDAKSAAAREKMAVKAELVGAIRLPDTAFKENARTEVVTDLVIMRRRTREDERRMQALVDEVHQKPGNREVESKRRAARDALAAAAPWIETTEVKDPLGGEPLTVNRHFAQHPGMVLGRLERSGSMHAGGELNVTLEKGADLSAMLNAAVDKLPQGILDVGQEVIDATIERHKTMSESLKIALAGEEPGHLSFDDNGKLTQVYERETPSGDYEPIRREVTPGTPWSRQLMLDAEGRWYKLEPKSKAAQLREEIAVLRDRHDSLADGSYEKSKLTEQIAQKEKAAAEAERTGAKAKQGRANVYQREYFPDNMVPGSMQLGQQKYERLLELTRLRNLIKRQIVLETEDAKAEQMEGHRKKLAKAYDDYVGRNGLLNDPRNMALINEMPDGPLLASLENSYRPAISEAKAKRTGEKVKAATAQKAAILSRRVVPKYEPPGKADSAADAISIVLSERGHIDLPRVAGLLGVTEDQAAEKLGEGEHPLAFYNPETRTWEHRGAYLTGQVRQKLNAARDAGLEKNVKELEAAQPERWGAEQVTPKLGANWIPTNTYEDFAKWLLGADEATVNYSPATNTFMLVVPSVGEAKQNEWGTPDMKADHILAGILNSSPPKVYRTDKDGTRHVDKEASTLVNLKAREIETAFADWVFNDADRRNRLVDIYNDKMNTRVLRQHDGSHLKLPGKVPDQIIKMRRHQLNAIWRGIYERFTLFDHVVGAGKTFTAIARVMERRRMGLSRKPMVAVPNHLVDQWAADVYRLYPGAKVLAAGKTQFTKGGRRRLFAKIATGDWDIVIVPHSSFGFIGISPDTELRFLDEELRIALQAVEDAKEEAAASGVDSGWRKPFTVKEAERLVQKIQGRIDALKHSNRDRMLTFEQMGVDDLTVDESHEFKNLFYSSRLTGTRGMGDKTGSKKAFDLYNKVRVLRENPSGSVTFMTGTPISNSAVEMYTMMRYLAANELKELGIEHFDAWRSQYVSAEPKWEPTESGSGLKEVTRLGRSWSNMRALMELYYSFTDAVSQEDINKAYAEDNNGAEFPIPKVKGGGRQEVVVKPTPAQDAVLQRVVNGFNSLDQISDPDERNAERLRLMDRARKVALDVRAVEPRNPSDEKGGKLDVMADKIAEIYKQWTGDAGTQLVFLDRSVPKAKGDDKIIKRYDELVARRDRALADDNEAAYREATDELEKFDPGEIEELRNAQNGGWNAYDQLKRNLIDRGIKPDEIRFAQEANNDAEKKALFDAVNDGAVRVLIGSTPRMGAGTNVQERIVALHHGDVTWKPSDIEQREGRGIRQGNKLLDKYGSEFSLQILAYATERTVDAKMWDLNSQKLRMINGIRKYDGAFNIDFEDEDSVNMAEIAALASGDPLLLERVRTQGEIDKLELQERGHRRKMFGIEDAIAQAERRIRDYPRLAVERDQAAADMRKRLDAMGKAVEKRSVTIEGERFNSAFQAEKAVADIIAEKKGGDEHAHYSINVDGAQLTSKDGILSAIKAALGDSHPFEAQIGGETYGRRYAAAEALIEAVGDQINAAEPSAAPKAHTIKVGTMLGADLLATITGYKQQIGFGLVLSEDGKTLAASTVHDIDRSQLIKLTPAMVAGRLEGLQNDAQSTAADSGDWYRHQVGLAEKELPGLQAQRGQTFQHADKLKGLRDRLTEITRELDARRRAAEGEGPAAPAAEETIGEPIVSSPGEETTGEPIVSSEPMGSVHARLTSKAERKRAELQAAVIAAIERVAGRRVAKRTMTPDKIEAEIPAAWRAAGAEKVELVGVYHPDRETNDIMPLIQVAMQSANPVRIAYHEAWHAIEGTLTPDELRILTNELPRLRKFVADHSPDIAHLVPRIEPEEVWAEAASIYTEMRFSGGEIRGIHAAVRRVFEKIRRLLAEIRKAVTGVGFNSADEIFEQFAGGEMARRRNVLPREKRRRWWSEPEEIEARLGRKGEPSSFPRSVKELADMVKGLAEDQRQKALGLLPLNVLADWAASNQKAVGEYIDLKRHMDAFRHRHQVASDALVQEWRKVLGKDGKALADLMHDTTLAGIDPATPTDEMKRNAAYPQLRKRFVRLSQAARDMYMKVRDAYVTQAKELDAILLENIGKAMDRQMLDAEREYQKEIEAIGDAGLTGKERREALAGAEKRLKAASNKLRFGKKARLAALRASFEANRVPEPYFPLARFGQYFATVRDDTGKVISFSRRETKIALDRLVRELKQAFPGEKIETGVLSNKGDVRSGMDPRLMADIANILGGASVSDDVMDAVWQRYLETLPDLSIRKRFIHRRGVAGFHEDALRSFASHMFHASHQMARVKYGGDLGELVNQAEDQARAAKDNIAAQKVANELRLRQEWVMNPTNAAWAQNATALGFIYYLGLSPASAIVNLSQTVILGIPVIGSRFGVARAAGALGGALRDFVAGKGTVEKGRLTQNERAAMEEGYSRGTIDRSMAHDLSGVGEHGAHYNPTRTRVMRVISFLFHHAERLNREVTFLAAYRLARKSGMSHSDAIDLAAEMTWRTHFDYSNTNRPRVMQGDAAKAILQFRNFQINMLYRLFRDTHQAFKGDTPAARREARLQLAGIMGMLALMSGALGVPLIKQIIIPMWASIFGDDDSEKDAKEQFRDAVINTLGPQLGGVVLDGVPGYLTGTSLTQRIGMGDLWFQDEDRVQTSEDWWNGVTNEVLGPGWGMAHNFYRGFNVMRDGKGVARGIEIASPVVVRNLLKSWRYAQEGVVNMRGDQVVPQGDIGVSGTAKQLIGFYPANVAEQYRRNNEKINMDKRISEKRKRLLDAAAEAFQSDDTAAQDRVMEQIREFNAVPLHGPKRITGQVIRRSIRQRARLSNRAESGVIIQNKRLNYLLNKELPERVY